MSEVKWIEASDIDREFLTHELWVGDEMVLSVAVDEDSKVIDLCFYPLESKVQVSASDFHADLGRILTSMTSAIEISHRQSG